MIKDNKVFSILCVDDEKEILEIIGGYVQDLGFNPILTTSPDEVENILNERSEDIALIISDFKMPKMDGFQLRKALLEKWKSIPFIICSAYISRNDALSAVDIKVGGFIDKPIKKDAFRDLVLKESKDRIELLNDELELKEGFINDAELLLEELEPLLLSLEEGNPEQETLNRIFAIAHTIKGTSAFFQPDTISKFTHRYEDFLAPYKKMEVPWNPGITEVLLKGADTIKILVTAFKESKLDKIRFEDLLGIFSNYKENDQKSSSQQQVASVQVVESKPREEVRVSTDLLKEFMELSGEITVIRNMINKLVKTIESELGANKNIIHLSELLEEMHKINGTLQDKVAELRKVPLKNIYRPLYRTVRDLGKSLDKEIEIECLNDSMKIDNSLAEVLSSSLIHMVRNSADHGIETPKERALSGKNSTGKIQISGKQVSEEIIIDITDDGKGLNTDFLRKKIIEKGLRTESETKEMSEAEIQSMIFESGFSTASQVTDVSGRGVGMDMVKKSIQKIGGDIKISSQIGRGTKFSLHLPIPKSVMIIPSILVRADDEICAIPQESIIRLINLKENHEKVEIHKLEGANCLLFEDSLIPIVELTKVFNDDQKTRSECHMTSGISENIVIVKANSLIYGIFVDEILDLEDTVVKKLGAHFNDLHQYLGATFLADGQVSLIIDTVGLADMLNINTDFKAKASILKDQEATSLNSKNILLFRLHNETILGVELEKIFRLEQIRSSSVKYSGEQETIIYRDGIMPLYCLNSLLQYPGPNILKTSKEDLETLVLKSGEKYLGIVISSILDLVQSSIDIDFNIADRDGILGAAIIHDKTVTMIDTENFLNLIEKYNTVKLESEICSDFNIEHNAA